MDDDPTKGEKKYKSYVIFSVLILKHSEISTVIKKNLVAFYF